ncbi:MAG TPA: G1 family glutamic endopeptidase [Solirubrobacteraceae bacterium]|nr:G1 family glutamic endopeptidase [Solirubrobacteraceae bacterium]
MKKILDGAPRAALAAAVIVAGVLCSAPAALAKTTTSSNWAGYAVHRPGVSFRQVSGTWTQPSTSCIPGQSTYSAVWVGIGGFKPTSDALEQIGTEVDCNPAGNTVSSAWYELVPAPSKSISLAVHPGDVMHATVTVVGHHVTVVLRNLTSHKTFRKSLDAPSIDASSAEWIVEAPSECISQFACQALPLANFGSVTFDAASATSTTGAAASIISPKWWRTRIDLTPSAQRFIVARQTSDTAGSATASTLTGAGHAFDVTYSTVAAPPQQFDSARQSRLRAAYIEH